MSVRPSAALVVLAAAVVACGGGSADPGPSGTTPAVITTTPEPTTPTSAAASGGASSSGGEQPTLRWDAVDGAALYSVVVAAADGSAYWGWQGPDTEVTVGEGAPSPLVRDDMTWTVIAYDDAGDVVWESGPLPI